MEDLLTTQKQLHDSIETLLRNFKKDGRDRKTPELLKRRLDVLDQYWQEFHSTHLKLFEIGDFNHTYFVNNQYEKTKLLYNNTRKQIESYPTEVESNISRPTTPIIKPAILLPGTAAGPSTPSFYESEEKTQGTHSKSDEMLRKQCSNFKAFARTLTSININVFTEKWEYEDALKSIESRWSAIDSLHWDLDSQLNESDQSYESTFNKYERDYQDIKKQINNMMWSMKHREKATPQMELKTFNGSYQDWTSFKDLFSETIHTNPTLSGAQKMQFLKSKLKGEAERMIQHLPISSENYQVCWEILNNRYNNKQLIFTTHINTILNLPTIQHQTAMTIKRVHDTANECLNAIRNLGVDISTWDPILVHLLSQKLDSETYNSYVESVKEPKELPNLAELLQYLEIKFTALEASRKVQNIKSPQQHQETSTKRHNIYQPQKSTLTTHNKAAYVNTAKCPFCKNDHRLFQCKNFQELSAESKRNTIMKLDICKNCLYPHFGNACRSEKRCRECNNNHNTMLHDVYSRTLKSTPQPTSKVGNASTSGNQPVSRVNSGHVSSDQNIVETLLATAQIRVLKSNGSYQSLRALVDPGSQTSLITEKAAQLLGLPRRHCKGVITGVGTKQNNCKGIISITYASIYNDYQHQTETFIMKSLINNLPNQSFERPAWAYLENLQLADPTFYISGPVDILLGAGVYAEIIQGGIIKIENHPIAQETHLGWILCGNIHKSLQCNVIIHNIDDLQKFWEIEDINQEQSLSEEDQHCLQYYQETTTRRADGHYEVRLPFKEQFSEKLGDSKAIAIAQFRQLERKFIGRPDLAEDYKSFIKVYIDLGHMIKSSDSPTLSCYLPHHAVHRADSTTTPLRVVFNPSMKTSSGCSLNDLTHRGPNLQKDLLELILKWRQFEFAFIADIEKMFRQIWLHCDDQVFHKIIWRNDVTHHLQEYQLATVTYGSKAAPFLSMMTLKRLAQDGGHQYQNSRAAQVLESDFYMDDLLSGDHTIESAKQLQTDLINLLKSGGFNLRKWVSNKSELAKNLDTEQCNQEIFQFRQLESTKTLGLRWHPHEDHFTFQLKQDDSPSQPKLTKRILLSEISKVFDPIGALSPVTTNLKLLFQQVWASNIQWDDVVSTEIKNEWIKTKEDLFHINCVKVPRWLKTNQTDEIELHGFSDATLKAYSCVIFCKINKLNQQSTVVLVAGKTRIVPTGKNISLPRLELSGALLLSKLLIKVLHCLSDYKIKLTGWTDSTAVLGWLNGDPEKWKPFVANRVRQIVDVVPANCWRYVKSADNPADCASRGMSASKLKDHQLWWNGPTWLPSFDAEKTIERNKYTTNEDIKKKQSNALMALHNNDQNSIINELLNKFSNMTRVVRVLAWIMRVSHRDVKQSYLTLNELNAAHNKIIKYVQETNFSAEIAQLREKKPLHHKSNLLNLSPFLDEEGLLRVGGRLQNANISYNRKHPLIIPNNNILTPLLINQAHRETFHGGARLTTAHLRRKYWIMGGNRIIKQHLRRCIKCRKNDPYKQHQIMADLPAARVNASTPFHHVGVDFTGYVNVKYNKGRGAKTTKGYVAVFVCMATKAVHLELVSDLSSSAFLAALRRMAARRTAPGHIYSDNGTNFVGSNRLLQEEHINLKQLLSPEFLTEITEMGIQWHFNAPSWPSACGLMESAVKSLKYHMKRVIGEQKLTFEEFSTVPAQLEACLNSRPLCAQTEDPDNIDCLTPAHFLASGPALNIIETERDLRTRWYLTQKITDDIWKRWRREYLSQLSIKSKWKQEQPNIKIDDIVIIQDDNLPPGRWALGRVQELHPGQDGRVRVVTLKTKSGNIKRPIVKLSILPVHPQEETPTKRESKQQSINDQKPSIKIPKQKTTITSTLLSILLILNMLTSVFGSYNVTTLNGEKGLYFDKIANMQIIRDDWKIIVYYDMTPYWEGRSALEKYSKNLIRLCENAEDNIILHCNVILSQLKLGFAELKYYDQMLLNQQFSAYYRRRTRRGLINGVGYIAHSLFGVLDDEFAEQYKRDISLVHDNQKHLALLWKNQTSIVEAEYNLLKRTEESMNKQHVMINEHLRKLENATNTLNNEVQGLSRTNDFILSTIIASNMLSKLNSIQETLLDIITNIYNAKFNIHLLTPEQLQRELNVISGQLSRELSLPINNIQTDLKNVYHLLRVRTRMTRTYLIFEVRIPLVTREAFEIYHLIPIPHQVNKNVVTIAPVSDILAINIQKDTYVPIRDIKACVNSDPHTYLCQVQGPIFNIKSDNSLCIKNEQLNNCKKETSPCKNIWRELETPNTYLYFCCDLCTLRIICEDQISVKSVSEAGIINLSANCLIKGDDFIIYSHKQISSILNAKPEVYIHEIAPINNLINVSIPINHQDLENVEDKEQRLQSIKQQIDQIKKETVLADRISYHDVHHYTAIYVVIGAAACVGAAWAWRRVRRARAARLQLPAPAPAALVVAAAAPLPLPPRSIEASASAKSAKSVKSAVSVVSERQDKASSPILRSVVFTRDETV